MDQTLTKKIQPLSFLLIYPMLVTKLQKISFGTKILCQAHFLTYQNVILSGFISYPGDSGEFSASEVRTDLPLLLPW